MSLVMKSTSPVAEKLAMRKSTMITNMSTSGVMSRSAKTLFLPWAPLPKILLFCIRGPKRLPGTTMGMT